ncbi:hypothetical protein NM004_004523 [Vibrio parahaemolyticus]|nr:hypothetical protein [Vibrio parahaemolyticus]
MKFVLNKHLKLTILVLFTGVLATLIQTYVWVDAGKSKINKKYEYQFQLNYWNNEIYDKFQDVFSSEVANKILFFDGEKVVDKQFFEEIYTYHRLVKELIRPLEFNNQVAFNLLEDMAKISGKGFKNVPDFQVITQDVNEFSSLLDELKKRKERLETFLPELMSSFVYDENMNESKKVELTVKQLKLFKELLTDEALFVTKDPDPFELIKNLGNASYLMLDNYEKTLIGYNKTVSDEDDYKKSLLFILALVSFYLSVLIAVQQENKSDVSQYAISVNDEDYTVCVKKT